MIFSRVAAVVARALLRRIGLSEAGAGFAAFELAIDPPRSSTGDMPSNPLSWPAIRQSNSFNLSYFQWMGFDKITENSFIYIELWKIFITRQIFHKIGLR